MEKEDDQKDYKVENKNMDEEERMMENKEKTRNLVNHIT